MMSLSLGLGLGVPVTSAPAGMNPNLLLWTDELDNAVWIATNISVGPDADGVAEELANLSTNGALRQVTTTAATAGAAVTTTITPGATYAHAEVSGTFDGQLYTLSGEFRDAGGGETLVLRIDRSGGFLRASLESPFADGDCFARHLQLEAGPFSTYTHRGGS